jgi:hypothetical protein
MVCKIGRFHYAKVRFLSIVVNYHMTPLELIFTALSEEATRLMALKDDAQGFNENYDIAQRGGEATGDARRNFEKKTGLKVVSSDNFLGLKGGDAPPELPEDEKD